MLGSAAEIIAGAEHVAPALLFGAAGAVVFTLTVLRPAWETELHFAALTVLGILVWLSPSAHWWSALFVAAGAATAWLALRRSRRGEQWAGDQREEIAEQLDRRISELFSLQELSYILAESIQLERIVEQVSRYTARFLRCEGAALVLLEGEGPGALLRVVSADGSLTPLLQESAALSAGALVRDAIERDRIEVMQGQAQPSVELLSGHLVHSAAVAPLRSHGVTLGALAAVDHTEGPFTTEDLWLFSTVATQASVVLANARLFEMVRQSTEEWETAFNALAEGIAVVDGQGRVERCNSALAELLGRPEAAVLRADLCRALFGEEDTAAEAVELIAEARSGARPAPAVLRSEELHRILRLTAAPLREQDTGSATVVLVEDVTDQRAMEAQLIQNEKMAAIGHLVSGVAHELNNPLTSIAGLTELLLERGMVPDEPRVHLRVIHEQAERAGRIVRNLLTFARRGTPEKEPVDLNDVVARTALLMNYDLRLRGVELQARLSPNPVVVRGDRYELQQVLLNLTTNALHAVDALEAGQPRVITVETGRQEEYAVLRVQDTGSGVPPAVVPYLFTPFFTTKGPGHGTGLGLSVSYGLVESHGGRISYQPAPAGGAEFTVLLPAYAGAPEAARLAPLAPPASANGSEQRPRRILVVDEDPAIHRVLSALFTTDGHVVEVTRSGANGLLLAADSAYDLVIADAQLQAAAGTAFVPALLNQNPELSERLLLAVDPNAPPPADLVPGVPLPWVRKPFNLRDLRAAAGEVLRLGGG